MASAGYWIRTQFHRVWVCFPRGLILKPDQHPLGWLSLLLWVLASGAGWSLIPFLVLGVVLPVFGVLFSGQTIEEPSEFSYAFQGAIFGIVLGVLFGVVIGVLQWLILRRRIARAYLWIAATVAGLGLGTPLGIIALRPLFAGPTSIGGPSYFVLLAAVVPGGVVGLLQRMVLQRHFNVTWWWILPSALTWPVSLIYFFESGEDVSLALGRAGWLAELGLALGIISGIALFLISRKRREGVIEPVKATARQRFSTRVVTAVLLLVFITAVSLFLTNVFSTRSPLLTLKGHTDGVTDVAFSPDGTLLASGSLDGTVRIWRAEDGELLHTLEHIGGGELPFSTPLSVSFSPDGEILASGAGNNTVKLWRVIDGTLLYTIPKAGHRVAFSPDGSTLASVGMSQTLQLTVLLWSVADGEAIRTLESSPVTEFCNSLAFSPDGTTLAGGFQDGVVLIWSVEDGVLLHTLTAHNRYSEVYVAFSPDGKTLASGSDDARIRFWRVDDGAFLHEATGDLSSVSGIAFSADGSTLVSVSYDYTVRFWCAANGKPIGALAREEHNQQSVAFSPDLKTMASGDWVDGVIRIYGIESSLCSERQGQESTLHPTEQSIERAVGLLFPEFIIILEDALEVKTSSGGWGGGYDDLFIGYDLESAPPQLSEAAIRLKHELESLGARGVEAGVVGSVIIVDIEQLPFKGYVWQGFIQVYDRALSGYLKILPSGD